MAIADELRGELRIAIVCWTVGSIPIAKIVMIAPRLAIVLVKIHRQFVFVGRAREEILTLPEGSRATAASLGGLDWQSHTRLDRSTPVVLSENEAN